MGLPFHFGRGPQTPISRRHQRGQVLPLFAVSVFVLAAAVAIVIDISWFWSNSLKVQRAADAAALAGAVYLPGNPTLAYSTARAEATKNGYTGGVGSVVVTTLQDPQNSRRLIVTITTPVATYFARIVGLSQVDVTQTGRAEYTLPVPMGSPLNYLGVFVMRVPAQSAAGDSGLRVATTAPTGNWSASGGSVVSAVQSNNDVYAQTNTNGSTQQFATFGFLSGTTPPLPSPGTGETLTITGLQVIQTDANASASCPNSSVAGDLSWNAGASWSSTDNTNGLNTSNKTFTLGSATSTSAWGTHVWVRNDFSDTNFRLRLTAIKGCSAPTTQLRVDLLQVIVSYSIGVAGDLVGTPVKSSDGTTNLDSQGFWATIGSQGMDKINGDAFSSKWDPRTTGVNAEYLPEQYYDYVIELAPGTTNGSVWVFDAPFCATDGSGLYGTGDRWFSSTHYAMSSFYTLYDSRGTLTDYSDDTLLVSSGNLFKGIFASDSDLGGPTGSGEADCSTGATSNTADGRYWHNRWWNIASGLTAGTTSRMLRLHVTTTDSASPNDQNNSDGQNSYSLEARGSVAPKVYGMGTMETYYTLPGGSASEFYLAQIDAIHAGKTILLELYDPGDTNGLRGDLQILQPTATGYGPATFSYTARRAASNSSASNCDAMTASNVTIVTSNTGTQSNFNGCWLTITIPLATTYSAPTPPGVPGPGWWKIRYVMSGSTADNAYDLVTIKVSLRGSPVHLVTQ
jgi:hypothetical protein